MGPTCKAFNYCAGNECSNHGSCKILSNRYRCNCIGGFKGTDCEFTERTVTIKETAQVTLIHLLVIVMHGLLAKIVKLQISA